MNYEEFIEVMNREVKAAVGAGVSVRVYEAMKNNGVKRKGLVIGENGANMSPTIYLEDFYSEYQGGSELSDLVESIKCLYERVKLADSYPYKDVSDYQKIKPKILYKLINYEDNMEYLKEVPYEAFFDMAAVPYVMFENPELGNATMQIKNEHLKGWGVDGKTVLSEARRNTPLAQPAELGQLTEYMYVLTNPERNFGAVTVCYPETLEKVWRYIGEDYYLLPSSIHEFILIPESYGAEAKQLQRIVREINATEVRAEEVLSNRVYYYNGSEKVMSVR